MSTKQRMITWDDLMSPEYQAVPDVAKPTAQALWLLLDPLGRGQMDPAWIASEVYPRRDPVAATEMVFEHLVMLVEAEFATTYIAEGAEWLQLLRPLKADLRRTPIHTPEPPQGRPWTSVAVGGAGARASERARAWARERVRAEGAARAEAWAAVERDRETAPVAPERPFLLDAPPMFCADHMPAGAGKTKCGPCRDRRLVRETWLKERVYEQQMAQHYEESEAWDGPF